MNLPEKIISGGQTGVDQGALDFALQKGIDCGGWCPNGRICETGVIPHNYPLKEVESGDYDERTRRNVRDADATLILTFKGRLEPGTRLTIEYAERSGQPHFHLEISDVSPEELGALRAWLESSEPRILNIAGNRESTSPGIRRCTQDLLEQLFFFDPSDEAGTN